MDRLLTVKEAAEVIGVSTKAVEQLLARETLTKIRKRVGQRNRVFIWESDARAYLADKHPGQARPTDSNGYWQEVAESQAIELLRLRALLASR